MPSITLKRFGFALDRFGYFAPDAVLVRYLNLQVKGSVDEIRRFLFLYDMLRLSGHPFSVDLPLLRRVILAKSLYHNNVQIGGFAPAGDNIIVMSVVHSDLSGFAVGDREANLYASSVIGHECGHLAKRSHRVIYPAQRQYLRDYGMSQRTIDSLLPQHFDYL